MQHLKTILAYCHDYKTILYKHVSKLCASSRHLVYIHVKE